MVSRLYHDRRAPADAMRCKQCGATEPPDGFVEKVVIHQDRDSRGKRCVAHSTFTVCKGTACGGNLQMAHEG
jgi:hypothetical protein